MPHYDLRGRVVAITGATGGLGSALATALRAQGAHRAVFEQDQDFPNFVNYSVQSLTDLNGDGVLEVVVEFIAWESAGAEVYEVVPGVDAELVLAGACGS